MFDKTKARVTAKFTEPIEQVAVLAAMALIVAVFALAYAMGGRNNAV